MQLYIPANEQELAEIESQVQEALASTLDFNLKRPEKLRELTCRFLGFENGYQQLKSAMAGAEGRADPAMSDISAELADFLEWMRTTTADILSTRELHGAEPRDAEEFLVWIMDEVVYDWCGTGKHVSDGINNQGLEAQVEAVLEASGWVYECIVEALEVEMPEMHPFSWTSWWHDTQDIPEGMSVYRDKDSGEWGWHDKLCKLYSWGVAGSRTFSQRSEAVHDAISFSVNRRM